MVSNTSDTRESNSISTANDTEKTDAGKNIPADCLLNRGIVSAVAAVVLLYVVMEALGITCPILFVTGISCAGCGMSRAWLALLRLDFTGAFYYHPLFWLPPVCIILFLFRKHFSKRVQKVMIFIAVALMLVVYLVRMLDPDDTVVVFRPQDGIFFRILSALGIKQ